MDQGLRSRKENTAQPVTRNASIAPPFDTSNIYVAKEVPPPYLRQGTTAGPAETILPSLRILHYLFFKYIRKPNECSIYNSSVDKYSQSMESTGHISAKQTNIQIGSFVRYAIINCQYQKPVSIIKEGDE